MKTFRTSAPRSALRLLLAAVLIALLSCSSAGCGRRVSYVNDSRALIKLKAGEPAPRDGVLMSEGYLSEIYEALKR
jgi:hypothetical protein